MKDRVILFVWEKKLIRDGRDLTLDRLVSTSRIRQLPLSTRAIRSFRRATWIRSDVPLRES